MAFLISGCSQTTLSRLPVYGSVPDAAGRSGRISLIPAEGTEAPAARASIRNGAFQFDESNGPMPGKYLALVELQPELDPDQGFVQVKGIEVPVGAVDGLEPDDLEERQYTLLIEHDGSLNVNLQ